MLGIICAMPDEFECCRKLLVNTNIKRIYIWDVYTGDINGISISLIMAGMGKVNAGLAVSILKEYFDAKMIIAYGTGGVLNKELSIGDLVVGSQLCYHDSYRPSSVQNHDADITFFMSQLFVAQSDLVCGLINTISNKLPPVSEHISKKTGKTYPTLKAGKIITGDTPSNSGQLAFNFNSEYLADCADMEGAGVAHACTALGIPFIVIRIMSDYGNENTHINILRYGKYLYEYLSILLPYIMNYCNDYATKA